jgi:hypothetical protein
LKRFARRDFLRMKMRLLKTNGLKTQFRVIVGDGLTLLPPDDGNQPRRGERRGTGLFAGRRASGFTGVEAIFSR